MDAVANPAEAPPSVPARQASGDNEVERSRNALSAFLPFLQELEADGICELLHDEVPVRFEGVSGWVVRENKMDEWRRRRQAWFMKGKVDRPYKPASFYQFLRRLGYFPTETTKRATHGLDFEGSRTFKWNGSHRTKYIQSKKERETVSLEINRRSIIHGEHPAMPIFGAQTGSWLPPASLTAQQYGQQQHFQHWKPIPPPPLQQQGAQSNFPLVHMFIPHHEQSAPPHGMHVGQQPQGMVMAHMPPQMGGHMQQPPMTSGVVMGHMSPQVSGHVVQMGGSKMSGQISGQQMGAQGGQMVGPGPSAHGGQSQVMTAQGQISQGQLGQRMHSGISSLVA